MKVSVLLLVLEPLLDDKTALGIVRSIEEMGLKGELVRSAAQQVIFVEGDVRALSTHKFSQIRGVARVVRTSLPCPLTISDSERAVTLPGWNSDSRTLTIGGATPPVVMAGPCSVESREHISDLSARVKAAGAHVLRGGAFKPRTSPYEFDGLAQEGMRFLFDAGRKSGMPVVSEVMSPEQLQCAIEFVDVVQIGARNMYNYELLKEVGRTGKPVLLKRGISATIDEYLQAIEYIMLGGNNRVILCERGIRTFETRTRNTLDLSAVPLLKSLTGLPVIVDPSHATGKRDLIRPMSRAAIACGADGLMIEVHADPDRSISDSEQAITPSALAEICKEARIIYDVLSAGDMKTHDALRRSTLLGAASP